ncbi:MAG: TlyA family RNA methyltransferase [Thermovirgaceae bacterium]|nr:TlyA family RNA methyltransferase [Synergistales bacterium]HPC75123.1 TlyA family RNA methyltransferase [Synergistales bacterium]HRS48405.1 TlyA family RNA methyltransferase [Thermovirgaceae bacterium]HRU90365.1 TlyA family RNA methyltransferase [Thermovirgaceae bacterium]
MKPSRADERLDQAMVKRGIAESRNRAQALVLSGAVRVNGEKILSPGVKISPDALIEIKGGRRWAGRGAYKLLKALDVFPVDPSGRICIDIGASTGGFTDVLLGRGAKRVYCVDVGYGQLAWRLRNDERVVVMERTNARYLEPGHLQDVPEIATMDVSFISVTKILPAVEALLAPGGDCIVLIKPQYEAGKGLVGRKGVIRDRAQHRNILVSLSLFIGAMDKMALMGADISPILGPSGNMEFLFHLRKGGIPPADFDEAFFGDLVERAHRELLEDKGNRASKGVGQG